MIISATGWARSLAPATAWGPTGYYYYAIPRHPGNTHPVKAFWYLGASDTLGNTASYPTAAGYPQPLPVRGPKPSNIHDPIPASWGRTGVGEL